MNWEVSKEIEALVPYSPGKPIEETKREFGLDRVVKLASNENALGPSPMALEALSRALPHIHRYPDASGYDLTQKLSHRLSVSPESIVLGNGSNELIDLLIRVFCEPGDSVLIAEKTFVAYQICAQAARVGRRTFPLDAGLRIPLKTIAEDLRSRPRNPKEKMIFLPNPNNPTGTYFSGAELRELLEVVKGWDNFMVVLDEAYNEFVRAEDYPNALELAREYPQLMVLRTMGKVYGMAGLRLGYAVVPEKVATYLHRVRNPFNVNSLAQAAALGALDDKDYIERAQKLVWEGLDYFYRELKRLKFDYVESQGNFVLFDTGASGTAVADYLLRRGVILRPVGGYGLPQHLRMSVGTMEENERAIAVLKEWRGENPRG